MLPLIASSINLKCSSVNSLLLGVLFRSATEQVWLYFFNRKYSDFLDTWIPSSESLCLIFMTGNSAFHIDTTLTLVFALMRPMFSARVLRVSPPLVLLLDLHTVLASSLKSLVLLLDLHTVLTSSLKSLVLLLSFLFDL